MSADPEAYPVMYDVVGGRLMLHVTVDRKILQAVLDAPSNSTGDPDCYMHKGPELHFEISVYDSAEEAQANIQRIAARIKFDQETVVGGSG